MSLFLENISLTHNSYLRTKNKIDIRHCILPLMPLKNVATPYSLSNKWDTEMLQIAKNICEIIEQHR